MNNAKLFEVAAEESGLRLDRWFKRRFPQLAHGRLEKLLRTGQVRVDGGRVKAGFRLGSGQQVRVPPLHSEETAAQEHRKPATAKLSRTDRALMQDAVLYNDGTVIAINKPAGLAVQGGSGTSRHVDGMLDALREEGGERPRLVHRLDRDTSGVLLLASTVNAAARFGQAFRSREARKVYWALTVGMPRPLQGRIRAPLAKLNGEGAWEDRERVSAVEADDPRGKPADTLYKVIDVVGQHVAWVAFMPLTGRTHQLRAHAAVLGTPIVGDRKYGGDNALVEGIAPKLHLHARSLEIPHPDGGVISVTAPLPGHMLDTWKVFGFDSNTSGDPFAEWDQ